MYGQKFNPYGQFPSKSSQMYEDEGDEEESEPLVEEIDSNYQPTEKEVRQYAIETLGMALPEDQGLLYLAREGLKAPLPPNWVPYQSRDGEVYYKHRITQEKTFDHPTDIEYQKKYEQQKEKMARKNLKSMNMKASNPLGMPANSNLFGNASNPFGSKSNNSGLLSGSSNIAQAVIEPSAAVKLDPRLEQELSEEVQMLEERLKKEWRDFEEQERQKHEKKIKKSKGDYESELDRLLKGKGSELKLDDKLKQQKQKIKLQIQQSLTSILDLDLRQYEKSLQAKTSEFISVYEDDNKLKVSKYQAMKDHQFQKIQVKYNENLQKMRVMKERKKRERDQVLAKLKSDLQNGHNEEIEQATLQALDQELLSIRDGYVSKLKQKENEFERQFDEMKKVLGFDQTAYITEIASKKSRMKKISQQKIESIKRKEFQMITSSFLKDLDESSEKLKEKLQLQLAKRLNEERHKQETKLLKQKQKIDQEIKAKSENQLDNIYDELKLKVKTYQTSMNKRLSTLNQKFISDIQGKSQGVNQDLTVRLELKEKEMTLQNKTQMIASLKRQKELQQITYDLLKLQSQLCRCGDTHQIDMKLMKLAKSHDLEYRTEEYLRYEAQYKEIKNKYRKDKDFLTSVMNSLQSSYKGAGVGGAAVLKQYNQDVRVMRENDEMLKKYEILLKKAEINDKNAFSELSKNDFQYADIQLRREMGKSSELVPSAFHELSEQNFLPKREVTTSSGRDIDSALRDHSKFLTTMRHELNRKLYKLRGSTYY